MTYSEKLKDPRWQKKRLLVFERDSWTCQSCGASDKTLHVHHKKYLPNLEPWEYEDKLLVTYCDTCHETEHLIGDTTRETFDEIINANKFFIRQLAQVCILIEKDVTFYNKLKTFLEENYQSYLKSQAA